MNSNKYNNDGEETTYREYRRDLKYPTCKYPTFFKLYPTFKYPTFKVPYIFKALPYIFSTLRLKK